MREININVGGDPGDDRPWLQPFGTPDEQFTGRFEGVEGQPPNRLIVGCPLDRKYDGGAEVFFAKGARSVRVIIPPAEGGDQRWEADLPPVRPPELPADQHVEIVYGPVPGEYPFADEAGGLSRVGRYLTLNGVPWQWRGASAFFAFARARRGEDLDGLRHFHRTYGVNVERVFNRCSRRTDFPEFGRPEETPGYWEDLVAYTQRNISKGLRTEHVVFTSGNEHTLAQQRQILDQTYAVLEPYRDMIFVEVANEPKPYPGRNVIDAPAIAKGINTRGILTALGCYDEKMDDSPYKDYGTMHTPRDDQWGRKARHLQEIDPELAMSGDEPMGVADVPKPGARTTDLNELVKYFAVAHCYSMGATLHSDDGIQGTVPSSGPQFDAFVRVLNEVWCKVGTQWQQGVYAPGHMANSPVDRPDGQVWTYSSLLGNKAFTVRCNYDPRYKDEDIPLKPKNGWRITETWGPANHLAFLER